MLPIWIINLTRDNTDREYFNQLFSSLTDRQRSYWYYSEIKSEAMNDIASCRSLVEELIGYGRDCYNHFQKEGFVIGDLQICIIGSVNEQLTRTSFHLIPSLLKEFLPSIQGQYVHRGVEITGMLFVPHNSNHWSIPERNSCALFLEELNTLVSSSDTDNYNRVVIYQDIQRPDARFYPELTRKQTVELLFQYILHLYYIDEKQPKIFDRLTKPGFYSLGAASVYYDSREHKEQSAYQLLGKLIETIKDPANFSEKDVEDMVSAKFSKDTIASGSILDRLQENCQGLNVDLRELEGTPDPHPLKDFIKPGLYTSYYLDYLRFMPARALEFTRTYSHLLTGKVFAQIRKNKDTFGVRLKEIIGQYGQIFQDRDYKYPTITQLKAALTELKTRFEKQKEQTRDAAGREERKVFDVPEYLSAYYNDCKTNNTGYTEKDLAENMKNALQSEPTIMGLLNRCFLLGSVMIFVLIPLLREISPFIINLGDVSKYEYFWIAGIFLLPFLFQFTFRLRRHFLFVRKQKHLLLAQALVKVQRKASAKVYQEAMDLYSEVIEECDKALVRCDEIERSLKLMEKETYPLELPRTLFNQPLIGGSFKGEMPLPDVSVVGDEIVIGSGSYKLSELETEQFLKLLKELFKNPEACPLNTLDLSEVAIPKQVLACLENMKISVRDKMKINEEHNISKVINDIYNKDESKIDLKPLFRMSDINGVITNSTSERGTIIRSYHRLENMSREVSAAEHNCNDKSVEPLLFVTTWSKPEVNQLYTKGLCDVELKQPETPLPFTTQMTCLYAQYKKRDSSYRLGDIRLQLTNEQLRELETSVNAMKP